MSPGASNAAMDLVNFVGPGPVVVRATRSRGGRPFLPVAERDLLPSLEAAARTLPAQGSGVGLTIAECPLPTGVPDLTVVFADRVALHARLSCGIPPLTSDTELRVVASCGVRRPTTTETLAEALGVSLVHARKVIGGLARRGALIGEGRSWRRAPELMPIGRTFALEAKVADWRAGLWQAMRYGGHADGSALVLQKLSDRTIANLLAASRAAGVGAYVDGQWLVRPRLARLSLHRRLATSEHIVAAIYTADLGCDAGS